MEIGGFRPRDSRAQEHTSLLSKEDKVTMRQQRCVLNDTKNQVATLALCMHGSRQHGLYVCWCASVRALFSSTQPHNQLPLSKSMSGSNVIRSQCILRRLGYMYRGSIWVGRF